MTSNGPTLATTASAPDNFQTALKSTVRAAADWLIANQKPDGHWVGRAESNACMEAQWCLALWFMGLESTSRGRKCD
jgi:squalene-hopene/tetraprenyl-beta-curcumene cyclase